MNKQICGLARKRHGNAA